MMDFIMVPLTMAIVCAAIYGLFELFVRRKERLAIIEKMGDKLDASALDGKIHLPSCGGVRFSFSSLKIGCLLLGIGIGLMFVLMFNLWYGVRRASFDFYNEYQVLSTAYAASILFFGGLGLLVAFIIESMMKKKENQE